MLLVSLIFINLEEICCSEGHHDSKQQKDNTKCTQFAGRLVTDAKGIDGHKLSDCDVSKEEYMSKNQVKVKPTITKWNTYRTDSENRAELRGLTERRLDPRDRGGGEGSGRASGFHV
jgi:hypothetical protein